MAFVPVIMTAFQVAGAAFGGMQESANSRSREAVARQNQQYAAINSVEELRLASREEARVRREGNKQLAEQFAAFAQSGAGTGDFSTQKALEESASMAELDALNVRYKGQLASRDQDIAGSQYDYEARSEKSARKGIAIKTALSMGTALLSGGKSRQGQRVGN